MVETRLQKDRRNQKKRERYAKLSDEERKDLRAKLRVKEREYRAKNKEKLFKQKQDYFKKNSAILVKKQKVYTETVKRERPITYMLREIKKRAKQMGVAFDLKEEDLFMPTHCPILGIPLEFQEKQQSNNSPSIDRIDPNIGYVRGNCFIISMKANRMKQDHTIETIKKFITYMEGNIKID